jgi:Mg2+ and Co2+ transporter CorA
MSDDLIKRLQYLGRVAKDYDQEHMTSADYEMIPAVTKQAAARIEQLVEENKELTLQLLAAHGQAADALDKLDKAVEMLQSLVDLAQHGRFVLRELEGGK